MSEDKNSPSGIINENNPENDKKIPGREPREFWIYDNGEIPCLAWSKEWWDDYKEQIKSYPDHHVIEYSAYEKLKAERANREIRITEVFDKLKNTHGTYVDLKEYADLYEQNQKYKEALENLRSSSCDSWVIQVCQKALDEGHGQ